MIQKNPNLFKTKNIALQNRRVFLAPTEDISAADLEQDKNEITELMLLEYPTKPSDDNDSNSDLLNDDPKNPRTANENRKAAPKNLIGMGQNISAN